VVMVSKARDPQINAGMAAPWGWGSAQRAGRGGNQG
jgi:hypothetical protein